MHLAAARSSHLPREVVVEVQVVEVGEDALGDGADSRQRHFTEDGVAELCVAAESVEDLRSVGGGGLRAYRYMRHERNGVGRGSGLGGAPLLKAALPLAMPYPTRMEVGARAPRPLRAFADGEEGWLLSACLGRRRTRERTSSLRGGAPEGHGPAAGAQAVDGLLEEKGHLHSDELREERRLEFRREANLGQEPTIRRLRNLAAPSARPSPVIVDDIGSTVPRL